MQLSNINYYIPIVILLLYYEYNKTLWVMSKSALEIESILRILVLVLVV